MKKSLLLEFVALGAIWGSSFLFMRLCGPEFGYLTGATIPLDGGQANFD